MANSKGFHVEMDIVSSVSDILSLFRTINDDGRRTAKYTSGGDYLPSSAARAALKPFIIGLIPPDVEVNFLPVERVQPELDKIVAGAPKVAPGTAQKTGNFINHPDSFYRKLGMVARSIGASPIDLLTVLYSESGLDPSAAYVKGKTLVGNGLNGLTEIALKVAQMPKDFWLNQYGKLSAEEQLPYVERYFKGSYRGAYDNPTKLYVVNFGSGLVGLANSPDAVLYKKYESEADKAAGKVSINFSYNAGFAKTDPERGILVADMTRRIDAVRGHSALKKHVARLEEVLGKDAAYRKPGGTTPGYALNLNSEPTGGDPTTPPKVIGGVMTGGNITDAESDDPLASRVGRNIRVSDKRAAVVLKQVKELNEQINEIRKLPGLLMLVNPSEFSRGHEHSVDTPKARKGPVVHQWLERPTSISCKGSTAAQYALDSLGRGGLTHTLRTHSLSYRNLMSLVSIYRNNGRIFTKAPVGDSVNSGIPIGMASVFIYYDGHIYIGSFDDFSVSDSADKPFNLSYSWKFTVRYDFDMTAVSDTMINRAIALSQVTDFGRPVSNPNQSAFSIPVIPSSPNATSDVKKVNSVPKFTNTDPGFDSGNSAPGFTTPGINYIDIRDSVPKAGSNQ